MKPFSALKAEELEKLAGFYPTLATGILDHNPSDFGVKNAESASVEIHLAQVYEDHFVFSGLVRFKAKDDREVSVAIKGNGDHIGVAYILPKTVQSLDAIIDNLEPGAEVIIFPSEWQGEILMTKGEMGVSTFFKCMNVYQESLSNATKMLEATFEEFDSMIDNVQDEKKQKLEEELIEIINQSKAAFQEISKLLPRIVEFYARACANDVFGG
ncbi:MAG TPA: hypothetical protein PLP64_03155 [Pseudothermotoga sp.]|nr:hypothetical protein [Pseudothermotoga sp.]HOK83203.1 hypothetical protein [Pseudothermotoga sp.]HPP71070.1 hypothetical protein [Pseudothermotoga sp.]